MLTMPRFQIPKENPFQKSKAYNLSYWQNLDASIQFVTDLADCSYTSATWADVAGFSNNTTLSRNKNGLFAQFAVPSTMDVGLAAFLLTRSAMVSDQSNHRFLDGHISERWWYGSARTTTRKKLQCLSKNVRVVTSGSFQTLCGLSWRVLSPWISIHYFGSKVSIFG